MDMSITPLGVVERLVVVEEVGIRQLSESRTLLPLRQILQPPLLRAMGKLV
jgi:hypothetical protein